MNPTRLLHFDGSFIESGIFYSGRVAAQRFMVLLEQQGAVSAVQKLDGFYRFVAGDDRYIWFGSDHAGSYPLFYRTGPVFTWSVHAGETGNDLVPDDQSLCCLMACGYVPGNYTLYKDVLEVEPGAVYQWSVEHQRLEIHSRTIPLSPARPDFDMLDDLTSSFFRAGTTVPHPPQLNLALSGGLDSRIILAQALRHGRKINAFSYGKRDAIEPRISEALCRAFDIPWTFYDFDEYRYLIEDKTRHRNFAYHAFSGRSIPQEQDYISGCLAGPGSLFLGGHSGDLIAGSYLTPELPYIRSRKALTDYIFYKHAQLTPVTGRGFYDAVWQRLAETFEGIETNIEGIREAAFRFNHQNRQRRYVVNSVRAYTAHGHPFFLPLYTKGLIDYFSCLPADEKLDQKFYKRFAKDYLFKGDLARLAEIESTRPMRAAYKPAGITGMLKFRIRTLDRYKLRKRLFSSQATGYASPLNFMMGETTDRAITGKRVAEHFPFLPELAAKFDDSGCPMAAAHLRKLQRYKAAQLNINGFHVLYYLGMLMREDGVGV